MGSRTGSPHAGVESDPEQAIGADDPKDAEVVAQKASYWNIIWYLVGGVVLVGIIKGFVGNGDIEVGFVAIAPASPRHLPAARATHSSTSVRPGNGLLVGG